MSKLSQIAPEEHKLKLVYPSTSQAIFNAQKVLDILLLDMTQDDLNIPSLSACRKGEIPIAVSPEIAVPVLLHKLHKERHFTMDNVARSMDVSYQSYQQIKAGKNITLKSLKRAATALGAIVEIKFHINKKVILSH